MKGWNNNKHLDGKKCMTMINGFTSTSIFTTQKAQTYQNGFLIVTLKAQTCQMKNQNGCLTVHVTVIFAILKGNNLHKIILISTRSENCPSKP